MSAITLEDPVAGAVRFQAALARLLLGQDGKAPDWEAPTLKALGRLFFLSPNWNSHGARTIDAVCVWAAWQLLTSIMDPDSPAPSIVPTVHGGVQLEWHRNGVDLEIEVAGPQQFVVSFDVDAAGESWEKSGEIDLADLKSAVRRLSFKTQSPPSEPEQKVFDKPVNDLHLSARARECMGRLGISTLGELIQRTDDELLEAKNFGMTSLAEVRDKLARLGLKLRKG